MRSALLSLVSLAFFEMIFASSDSSDGSSSGDTQNTFSLSRSRYPYLYLAINENGCYLKKCPRMVRCVPPRFDYSDLPYAAGNITLTEVGTNFSESAEIVQHKTELILKCDKGNNKTDHYLRYQIEILVSK